MSKFKRIALIVNFTILIAACGSDSSNPIEKTNDANIIGIFEVVGYQTSNTGCSNADLISGQLTENHFFIKSQRILSKDYFMLYSCVDLNDCKDKASQFDAGNFPSAQYFYTIDANSSPQGYISEFLLSGHNVNNNCTGGSVTKQIMTVDSSTSTTGITLKLEETPANDYPAESDGSQLASRVQRQITAARV